jgi:hypothetical protein
MQQGVGSVRLDMGLAIFCSLRWNAQPIKCDRYLQRGVAEEQEWFVKHHIATRRKVNRDRSAFTFFQQTFGNCNENRRYLGPIYRCHPNVNPSKDEAQTALFKDPVRTAL